MNMKKIVSKHENTLNKKQIVAWKGYESTRNYEAKGFFQSIGIP